MSEVPKVTPKGPLGHVSPEDAFVLGVMCCFLVLSVVVGAGIGVLIRLIRH